MNRTRSKAGKQLVKWLKSNKKSQAWLVGQLKRRSIFVAQTTVSAWLCGGQPRADAAVAVEAITGIPVPWWGVSTTEVVPLRKRRAA